MAGNEKCQFLLCDDDRGMQDLFKILVEKNVNAELTIVGDYSGVRRLVVDEKRMFDSSLVDLSLTGGRLMEFEPSSGAEVADFLKMFGIPTALISEQTASDEPKEIARKVFVDLYDLREELDRGIHNTFLDVMNGVRHEMKPKNRREFHEATKPKVKFSTPRDGD